MSCNWNCFADDDKEDAHFANESLPELTSRKPEEIKQPVENATNNESEVIKKAGPSAEHIYIQVEACAMESYLAVEPLVEENYLEIIPIDKDKSLPINDEQWLELQSIVVNNQAESAESLFSKISSFQREYDIQLEPNQYFYKDKGDNIHN